MPNNLSRVQSLLDLRRYAEAEALARTCLVDDPDSESALFMLAKALLHQDKKLATLEAARQVVATSPDDADAHQLLAEALIRFGLDDQAVKAAREGVRLSPASWRTHYTLARALRAHQRFRDALEAGRIAVRLAPNEPDPRNLVGICHSDLHQDAAAVKAFKSALRLDPSHAGAMNNLAAQTMNSGQLAKASSLLAQGLAADPQEKLLHQNYDALLLMLIRRLYFALIPAAILLSVMAVSGAPYPARIGTAVALLAIYAASAFLVVRRLPRGTHLWVRGLFKRIRGGDEAVVVLFVIFTVLVIALAVVPAKVVPANVTGILVIRGLIVIILASVGAARRRGRRGNSVNLRRDRQG